MDEGPPHWIICAFLMLKRRGKSSDNAREQAHLLKENFKLDPFYKSVSETEIYKNLLQFFRETEQETSSR